MSNKVRELHLKRKKMWEGSIANHKRYIDPSSGLFAEEFVENRACPVCEVNSELCLFCKKGGQYVKCKQCGMVYLNPVFKDECLEDYYRVNHELQSEIVEEDSAFYIGLYKKGLDAIEKEVRSGDILDVGCSAGLFLDVAKGSIWNTYGVELNEKEAKHTKDKGHTIYNEMVEAIDFNMKFDAVTLWDVFEHLKDGGFYLKHLTSLLKKGGVLFLQIPSADSLAARMLKEECNMFDGLEHVNLYSFKSIEVLAAKCHLNIVNMETVISEVGVMNNYLNYESPYFGTTNNTSSLLSLIDEEELHQHKLGYKMQILLSRI